MPAYRIGLGSDFNLNNQLVGIGTTTAGYKLTVSGGVLKGDFSIPGVTTLTSYGGFTPEKQNISAVSSIGFTTTGIGTVGITSFISINERDYGYISLIGEFNTVSEDIVIDEGRIFDISTITNIGITTIGTQSVYVPTNSIVNVGTLEHVSIGTHFSFPNGGIAARPEEPIEGTVRFNDDLNTLEFYNGVEWRQFTVDGSSGRGVFGGGISPSAPLSGTTNSDYLTISTLGNAVNFGNLSNAVESPGACSSSIRGLFGGGRTPTLLSAIDYITIASEGNAISFGSLTQARIVYNAASSSTRGIFFSGYVAPSNVNTIDYVQISTLGNAIDFGDVITLRRGGGSFSSPTRAIYAGGYGSPGFRNEIEFLTISTTGNMVDFGDLTNGNAGCNLSCSNTTRGIIGGGANSGTPALNTIDYITIASLGNAIKFGDLTQARRNGIGGVSSSTRGVFGGGYDAAAPTVLFNTIDYITIATIGNAQDFGDLNTPKRAASALSDSHGGIGGF